jgi:hypothetical protein
MVVRESASQTAQASVIVRESASSTSKALILPTQTPSRSPFVGFSTTVSFSFSNMPVDRVLDNLVGLAAALRCNSSLPRDFLISALVDDITGEKVALDPSGPYNSGFDYSLCEVSSASLSRRQLRDLGAVENAPSTSVVFTFLTPSSEIPAGVASGQVPPAVASAIGVATAIMKDALGNSTSSAFMARFIIGALSPNQLPASCNGNSTACLSAYLATAGSFATVKTVNVELFQPRSSPAGKPRSASKGSTTAAAVSITLLVAGAAIAGFVLYRRRRAERNGKPTKDLSMAGGKHERIDMGFGLSPVHPASILIDNPSTPTAWENPMRSGNKLSNTASTRVMFPSLPAGNGQTRPSPASGSGVVANPLTASPSLPSSTDRKGVPEPLRAAPSWARSHQQLTIRNAAPSGAHAKSTKVNGGKFAFQNPTRPL